MRNSILNESYGTLSQTINALYRAGYSHDFNIQEDCLVCHQANLTLAPEDFQIDEVYRFEGDSDPEYQSILYAISSSKYNLKGVLVNGYGNSSDENTSRLIEKLQIHPQKDLKEVTPKFNDTTPKFNDSTPKFNEATPQRPEGDRVLNAPFVEIDLNAFLKQLKSESTWAESDRNSVTVFKSDAMRLVLIGLHKNAELKPHKANGQISVQVIEGQLLFTASDQIVNLKVGQMITLHENITHSVRAVEDSFFLLTLAIPQ